MAIHKYLTVSTGFLKEERGRGGGGGGRRRGGGRED